MNSLHTSLGNVQEVVTPYHRSAMFKISGYEHIGVRVTDKAAAIAFYRRIGFYTDPAEESAEHEAVGLVNDAGVRINLIYNGVKRPGNRNILMDEPRRHPGFTHPAFIVDSLDSVMQHMHEQGVRITEGPLELGKRRRACFIRDPDGNVIEFDELY